ncbi:hypothetical protein [Chryseobacterium sp. YIM B08800]|uniref:hypothetical protein n=1 Tax=Chryseobacterium sp. YIM B08800 TaxID=2984136 RepID=UPI002240656A|nr:hypothetical protein [Chryseobacterium sp. YIM B08800]
MRAYLFILLIFTSSCTKVDKIEIYNPYDDVMKVKIDDMSFELPSKSGSHISLSIGKHKVYSFADKKLLDTVFVVTPEFKEKGGYLNLSNQPVYLWSQVYGEGWVQDMHNRLQQKSDTIVESAFENKSKALQFKTVKIDSDSVFGPIREFSRTQLTIDKNWYFFIGQEFKDEITSDDKYLPGLGTIVNKLFSKDEMIEYWRNMESKRD